MQDVPKQHSRFDGLEIDWGRLQIVRAGSSVKLTPKAAAVLRLLIEQHGATVARKTILDAVWPGTFSSDEVLTQVVAELRRALDDAAKTPRWIETVPKLGYRWAGGAPLEAARPDATPEATLAPPRVAQPARGRRAAAAAVLLVVLLVALLALLGYAYRAAERTRATAPPPVELRPVTSERGTNLDPALSRDGRLAYVHTLDDRATLRVRAVGAAPYDDVALGDDGRPAGPAWSPDGTRLAYLWLGAGGCELRTVVLATHAVATVATRCPDAIAGSVDWSPDGAFLVFARVDDASAPLGGRSVSIWRVAPDGSDLRRLSNAHRWLVVDGHPRVAPGAREVAFVRDGEGRRRIVRVAADAGSDVEHDVPFGPWAYRLAWHGDGLLVAAHGTTPAEIWRVGLDGAQPLALATAAGPGLAVSADGLLVYEQRVVDDNVWSVPLGDAAAQPTRVTSATHSELCPRVSPDGRTLAYLADDAGTLEITLHDLASGARRRISRFAPRSPVDVRWAPSGRWLAAVVGGPGGKRLALLDSTGQELELPADVAAWPVTQAEWTHDERHLLVGVENEGRRELRRVAFPSLNGVELVSDESIGGFASAFDDAAIHVNPARTPTLARLDAAFATVPIAGVALDARPADQWLVRDGVLAQMIQVDRGGTAVLRHGPLAAPGAVVDRRIAAPDPPLGRNFDVGHGRLWYTSRDLANVDLVSVRLRDGARR